MASTRPSLLRLYPANSDAEARRAAWILRATRHSGLQMRTWARAQTSTGKSPAYMYLFSRVHPYAPGVKFSDHDPATIGAYHTADVPYWLQTLDSLNLFRTTRDWTPYDRELATRMSDVIVSFARTGKPVLERDRLAGLSQRGRAHRRARRLGARDPVAEQHARSISSRRIRRASP